jgi:glycosyltransferase involved in cell wall biosynthesis
MRIAQVAPLEERVPPKLYGGTERIVSYLTEELVRQGHDVTLFASGDSVTAARLVAPCKSALRLEARQVDPLAYRVLLLDRLFRAADDFDVIHFHTDYLHFPLSRRHPVRQVTTLHGRLDLPDLVPVYREFAEMPLVSISDAQRAPLSRANWQATVHHGLPRDLYTFHPEPGRYLAFLGRISPEKRVDRAIEIARGVGLPLRIAAKIDRVDREYFDGVIRPLLDDPLVEFVGEIGEREKGDFLGNALAFLCPIDWPEPFGLVMIESMACGTPVVAFRRGSVPEVIDEGVSGFVVDTVDEAVAAVACISEIRRKDCRDAFETRFLASRMAKDYVTVYEALPEGAMANDEVTAA